MRVELWPVAAEFSDIEFGDQLKLEFFEGTDHVFTSEKDRARLYDTILDWMTTNQPRPAAPQISAAE